jgi:hypothetical protein
MEPARPLVTSLGVCAAGNASGCASTTLSLWQADSWRPRTSISWARGWHNYPGWSCLSWTRWASYPSPPEGAKLLFQAFAERYLKGSLLITSNLEFSRWLEVFGDERMTGALLDRLTHHCHILEYNGDSYRFKESLRERDKTY